MKAPSLDALVRGMTALTDVWELIPPYDQLHLLELLLPGVQNVRGCWDELTEPLQQLIDLDGRTAIDTLREAGARGPLDPQTAYDTVRAALEHDIADVLNAYRTDQTDAPRNIPEGLAS